MKTGFVGSIFDFSFSNFVTSKIVKIIYVLALILICLFGVGIFFSGLARGNVAGFVTAFIGTPLYLVIAVLYARVFCEILIIIFKISENLGEISDKLDRNLQEFNSCPED